MRKTRKIPSGCEDRLVVGIKTLGGMIEIGILMEDPSGALLRLMLEVNNMYLVVRLDENPIASIDGCS